MASTILGGKFALSRPQSATGRRRANFRFQRAANDSTPCAKCQRQLAAGIS